MEHETPVRGSVRRRVRSDALANQERVLAAAVTAVLREGTQVPMGTIAADAGVCIGARSTGATPSAPGGEVTVRDEDLDFSERTGGSSAARDTDSDPGTQPTGTESKLRSGLTRRPGKPPPAPRWAAGPIV
jgi:hypothetical protein